MTTIAETQVQIRRAIDALNDKRDRNVSIAITHLETAQLWLMKAAVDAPKPQRGDEEIVIVDPCEYLKDEPWYIRWPLGCF